MSIRIIVLTLAAVALTSCNAVPKSGVEARKQAYSRMDQVNAAMSRRQAVNALETGQLNKARRLVTAAIERRSDDAVSWSLLGRVLMEQMRLDEAVRALKRSVELNPNSSHSLYFLGVIHERWSKDKQAAEYYTLAFEAEPTRAQFLMAAAETHLGMGDLASAGAMVKANLQRFEHHAAMQHLLAHMSMLEGDVKAASERCEEARLLAPQDESIARDLCRMRFRAGDWGGCIDAIEDWQFRFKGLDSGLEQLRARCLVLVNRHNEARAMYRTLCDGDLENVSFWRERGLVAWDQQDWQTLGQCGQALANLRPGMYEATLFKAAHYRSEGELEVAQRLLDALAAASPERPEAWVLLSTLRAAAGDSLGAAKARDIAVKCDPALADVSRVTGVFGSNGS
jgi:predicted Zn-dependent protease